MSLTHYAVRDWMTPIPDAIRPEDSVLMARQLMDAGGFRHLPVVAQDQVVGIVSDRDLRSVWPALLDDPGAAEQERRLASMPVRRIMTANPIVVGPHASLQDAVRLLIDLHVGALPVIEDGVLVGILSESDALRALLSTLDLLQGAKPRAVFGS
jgi:CBS domain-containing protein